MQADNTNNLLHSKQLTFETMFSTKNSISNLLNYEKFIDNTTYVLTTDGHIGVTLKIDLVDHSPMSKEQVVNNYRNFANLFSLPDNTVFQFLFSSPMASNEATPTCSDEINTSELGSFIATKRKKMFKKSRKNKQCYLVLKFPVRSYTTKNLLKGIFHSFNSEKKALEEAFKLSVTKIQGYMESYLELNKGIASLATKDEFFELTRGILNNGKTKYSYCSEQLLKEQMAFESYQSFNDKFVIDSKEYAVVSIKNYPSSISGDSYDVRLGAMIDTLKLATNGDFELRIALNGRIYSKEHNLSLLTGYKAFFLLNERKTAKIRKERGLEVLGIKSKRERQREELETVEIIKEDERSKFVKFSTHFIVETNHVNKLEAIINKELQANPIREKLNTKGLFFASLPLQYDPLMDLYANRSVVFSAEQTAHFLPLWKEFEGHKKGDLYARGRDGHPLRINVDSTEAGHISVLGASGGGKSVIINAIETAQRADKDNFFVFKIDANTTSKVSTILDKKSVLIEFTKDNWPMNPFSGSYDRSKIDFLSNFLLLTIKTIDPSFKQEAEHLIILQQAIAEAYNARVKRSRFSFDPKTNEIKESHQVKTNLELSLDEIIAKSNEIATRSNNDDLQKISSELARKLSMYYGNGLQADLFKGKDHSVTSGKTTYIYDLNGLDSKNPFTHLISYLVTSDIESKIQKLKATNPDAHGIVVVEEIGYFGNNPIITEKNMIWREKIRKDGFKVISCSPRIESFFDTEIGRTSLQTSETLIFGPTNKDSITRIVNNLTRTEVTNKKLKEILEESILNEAFVSLLSSLEKKAGYWTQYLFFSLSKPEKNGIFEYSPLPEELWRAASGNPKMNAKWTQALDANKGNASKTFIELCQKFPRGIV